LQTTVPRWAYACSIAVVCTVPAACGTTRGASTTAGGGTPLSTSSSASADGYPATIENLGRTLTFDKPGGTKDPTAHRTSLNLGQFFGVRERAEQRVTQMKAQIADIAQEIAGIITQLIEAAGGENVFADGEFYFQVSLETIAKTSPSSCTRRYCGK
jgi:hypothetical protein